ISRLSCGQGRGRLAPSGLLEEVPLTSAWVNPCSPSSIHVYSGGDATAGGSSGSSLTRSRSVLAKSSPTHKSGSPARDATAYVQQSPKFKAAGCLPLPNRE